VIGRASTVLSETALPRIAASAVPAVTAAQMREIDRLATDEFGIELAQMLELAGAGLADSARQLLGQLGGARVVVLVGSGNNGAGGLVAARHLANRGALVQVLLARPVAQLSAIAQDRVATLVTMRVPACVVPWDMADGETDELLDASDLVIDALLGYAAEGPPRDTVATLIERANVNARVVLSLDLPSGIAPDSGDCPGVAISATATMTVALPKRGLMSDAGRRRAGTTYLADIGLPAALYRRAGLEFADPFVDGRLVHLD
jgi:NAD(P)H-hydrate epimerase